jgi:hypothetical protein
MVIVYGVSLSVECSVEGVVESASLGLIVEN